VADAEAAGMEVAAFFAHFGGGFRNKKWRWKERKGRWDIGESKSLQVGFGLPL
jgi:hypothetical protein